MRCVVEAERVGIHYELRRRRGEGDAWRVLFVRSGGGAARGRELGGMGPRRY